MKTAGICWGRGEGNKVVVFFVNGNQWLISPETRPLFLWWAWSSYKRQGCCAFSRVLYFWNLTNGNLQRGHMVQSRILYGLAILHAVSWRNESVGHKLLLKNVQNVVFGRFGLSICPSFGRCFCTCGKSQLHVSCLQRKPRKTVELEGFITNQTHNDPRDWYIYLHEWLNLMGKCR